MRRPYHPYLYPSVSVSIGNKREGPEGLALPQHYGSDEATWEDEELFRKAYPELFENIRHRDDVQTQGGKM